MKKSLVFLFAMAMMVSTSVKAQAPQLMSFQSVIRDNTGKLVANHNVGLRLSIVQGTVNGTAVYTETQTATSNANGLVTLQIGGGSVVSGTFSAIDWSAGPYYIKSEIDPIGGNSYGIAGTTQLLSVAYALYAGKSQSSIVSINGLKGHYGFDHSTTWTCPKGITSVEVELWGASGGGGGCINYNYAGSGAGGNGGNGGYSKSTISVIPDSTYNIKIGKGGAGGNSSILNGTDGGNTSFGNLLSAQEGKGGLGFYYRSGVIQSGANGQSGQILNYNVTPLTSRTYIPSGYTILYPSSTAEGGTGAYWYSYGNNGGATNGEDGFCVISY